MVEVTLVVCISRTLNVSALSGSAPPSRRMRFARAIRQGATLNRVSSEKPMSQVFRAHRPPGPREQRSRADRCERQLTYQPLESLGR